MLNADIVGIGQTEFSSNSGRSEMRLAIEATLKALADCGLEPGHVDGLVRYTLDSTAEADLAAALGLEIKYYGQSSYGGTNCCGALAQAAGAVSSGVASCVVLYRSLNARSGVRFGRAERSLRDEGDDAVVSIGQESAAYCAPFGLLVPPQFHALCAKRYQYEHGLTDDGMTELLGNVAVTQRDYANTNPQALMRDRTLSFEQYASSRMIATPLRLFDLCLETDGAMAIVIASPKLKIPQKRVRILAAAQYMSGGSVPMMLYKPDLSQCCPPKVGRDLFEKAGVKPSDIDVAGLYDASSILVPMALEDFGFVERGGAHEFLTSGQNKVDGKLPVNTHGGLLSEGYFHGLNTIGELVRQLRGTASNQVDAAKLAFMTVRGASSVILGAA